MYTFTLFFQEFFLFLKIYSSLIENQGEIDMNVEEMNMRSGLIVIGYMKKKRITKQQEGSYISIRNKKKFTVYIFALSLST